MKYHLLLIEAKKYLEKKVNQGIYEEAIFTVLDDTELIMLYQKTKEKEDLWKSL